MANEEAREQAIRTFREFTHTDDAEQAARLLEWHEWQVDAAVSAFMLGNVEPPASYFARRAGNVGGASGRGIHADPAMEDAGIDAGANETDALLAGGGGAGTGLSMASAGGAGNVASASGNAPQGWIGWVVSLPFRVVFWALGLAFRPLASILGIEDAPRDGEAAARRFVSKFEMEYGRECRPRFIQDSYKEAVAQASREMKFLVVYLHSPLHEDTPTFCKDVLCSETMVEFLDSNFLVWGGSTWHAEAFAVGNMLGATTFPSTALLLCKPNEVQVVERVPGAVGTEPLMERLSGAMARFQEQLERVRRQMYEREEGSRLRREQDAEYQAALDADRRRQEAEAEGRRRREEEEREARIQADLAKAAEESRESAKVARRESLRASVAPEPPSGPDATRVRLQMPSGAKIDRRFVRSHPVGALRDFVSLHLADNAPAIERFSLSTNYPRRELEEENDAVTLEEAGLHPQVLLFVHDLDA